MSRPHPRRLPFSECMRPLCYSIEMADNISFWPIPKVCHRIIYSQLPPGCPHLPHFFQHARPADGKAHGPVQSLVVVGERLVCVFGDLAVHTVRLGQFSHIIDARHISPPIALRGCPSFAFSGSLQQHARRIWSPIHVVTAEHALPSRAFHCQVTFPWAVVFPVQAGSSPGKPWACFWLLRSLCLKWPDGQSCPKPWRREAP
jgi:hypothetical protein